MSGVLRRTMFIDEAGGLVRWHDWSTVITEIGVMMEPNTEIILANSKDGFQAVDNVDPQARVDEIKNISLDRGNYIVGDVVTGGNLLPRTGR